MVVITLCLIPSAQVRDAKHADLNFQIEGAGGARPINISHRQGDQIELRMDYSLVLIKLLVGLLLADNIQLSRGCAPSCNDDGSDSGSADDDLVLPTTFFKTIQTVAVSNVEEARVRGACHSICITAVRILIL